MLRTLLRTAGCFARALASFDAFPSREAALRGRLIHFANPQGCCATRQSRALPALPPEGATVLRTAGCFARALASFDAFPSGNAALRGRLHRLCLWRGRREPL